MHDEINHSSLTSGLYFVSVPIGNARDITLRALDILASAEVLAAEDTRSLRKLMEIHGIPLNGRRVHAYHDHNGASVRPRLLRALEEGKSVAYASEAGTPLVADPGFSLGREARNAGYSVNAVPGASAVLAALTVSGLPTDSFVFAGFAPNSESARRSFLKEYAGSLGTLVLYESPRRVSALLAAAADVLGPDRQAAVCRELTKKFEEVRGGTLSELAVEYGGAPPKGEVVVCIAKGEQEVSMDAVKQALVQALKSEKLKTAAGIVAEAYNLPKRDVYQLGLSLRDQD